MDGYRIPNINDPSSSEDEDCLQTTQRDDKPKSKHKSCNQYTYKKTNNHNLWTPFLDNALKQAVMLHAEDWNAVATHIRTHCNDISMVLSNAPSTPSSALLKGTASSSVAKTQPEIPVTALANLAAIACEEDTDDNNAEERAEYGGRSLHLPLTTSLTTPLPAVLPLPLSLSLQLLGANSSKDSTQVDLPGAATVTAVLQNDSTTSAAANAEPPNIAQVPFIPSAADCSYRWNNVLKPHPSDNFPPWSAEEMSNLNRLVDQQQRQIEESGRPGKMNWQALAAVLGRNPADVQRQHEMLYNASLRHGTFTPEEDAYILKRYREWHAAYPGQTGLWVALEKEMSRKDKRISERWRHVLAKRYVADSQTVDLLRGWPGINYALNGHLPPAIPPASSSIHSAGMVIASAPNDGTATGTGDLTGQSSTVGRKRALSEVSAMTPGPVVKGGTRWDEAMDNKLREAISLYPRDWIRISQYVGVEAYGSKCRKRWARIQEKHRKSIIGANKMLSASAGAHSGGAGNVSGSGVGGGGGGGGYDRVDSSGNFSFGDVKDSDTEGEGNYDEDLGEIGGGLDLDEGEGEEI